MGLLPQWRPEASVPRLLLLAVADAVGLAVLALAHGVQRLVVEHLVAARLVVPVLALPEARAPEAALALARDAAVERR